MTDRDSGRPPREPLRTDPVAGFPDGPEPPDDAGAEAGEESLRRLLRHAVDGIAREPAAGTLDHLRQAVTTRRRRRRQLLFGAAASVALLGIGTPLVLSATGGSGGPGRQGAALGSDQGAVVEGTHEQGGEPGGPGPYPSDGRSWSSAEPRPDGSDGDSPEDGGGGQEADGDSDWDLGIASPTCDRGQLGQVTTVTGTPDGQGRVYGSIRLVNVSADACRVTGNGELSALPLGGSFTTAQVQVLDRTEGDRAPGLPAPDETPEELVLPPGEAYEVRFAWVPSTGAARSCEVAAEPADDGGLSTDLGGGSEPGSTPSGEPVGTDPDGTDGGTGEPPSTGGTGEPATGGGSGETGTTEPTPPSTGGTGEPPATGGGTGETGGSQPPVDGGTGGTDPTPGGTGGGGAESSEGVLLRYTPAAGGPEAAQIRLEGSCSGTVYRTGVLEAPAV
ncbi:hypothetical protein ACL02R_23780 [Streptomyces sp. MS19]|uniref:hypothetical protein n=1 Tax=Streptomyces sp. MS19 TaxID=3385972 RepID=UPI0039A251D2